jgi:hypothetical protein
MFTKIVHALVIGSVGLGTMLPLREAHAAPTTQDVVLTDIVEQLVPKELVAGDREFGGHGPKITTSVQLSISEDRRKIKAKVFFNARETQADWSETRGERKRTVYTAPAGRTIREIVGAVEDGAVVATVPCAGSPAGSCVFSQTKFKSGAAGFQILAPTQDWQDFIKAIAELVDKIIQAEQQLNDRDAPTQEERDAQVILDWVEQGAAFLPSQENRVYLKSSDNGGPVRVFAIVGDTGGPDISTDDNGKDDTRVNAIMFKKLRIKLD